MDSKLLYSPIFVIILALVSESIFAFPNDTSTEAASLNSTNGYPIVLVHGLFGSAGRIGSEGWGKIPTALRDKNRAVYIAQLPPINGAETNGEYLAAFIEEIIAIYEYEKVNIIAHSYGGLPARYVASIYPHMVASVTTIGTPNQGSPVADFLYVVGDAVPIAKTIIEIAGYLFGSIIDLFSGNDSTLDSEKALNSGTMAGANKFSQSHPQGIPEEICGEGDPINENGIYYFSWGGDKVHTHLFDPTDLLLTFTTILFFGQPNDGLVSICSNHLGTVIKDDYRLNHFDLVDGIAGLVSKWGPDPVNLYVLHANRLELLGL